MDLVSTKFLVDNYTSNQTKENHTPFYIFLLIIVVVVFIAYKAILIMKNGDVLSDGEGDYDNNSNENHESESSIEKQKRNQYEHNNRIKIKKLKKNKKSLKEIPNINKN